ncbi:MAG TPA: hypothetical protein VFM28_10800 [Nitrososphaeraceae archaeon]|nr:hypothetical protein [Nitrososphaeraceae archaeon]
MLKLSLSIISIFLLLVVASSYLFNAFGHSFTTDDSTYLLTLIEKTKTELQLANKNYPSNITLSMDHSENAARLVYDTFYADEDIANDDEFTKRYNQEITKANSTAHALVVVTLVDDVLRNYADSIDLNFDLTNMSNLLYVLPTTNSNNNNKLDLDELESYFIDILNNSENNSVNTDKNNNNPLFIGNQSIINYADYETAKLLAMKISTSFQLYLKSFIGLDKTKLDDITKLEDDFYEFYSMINEKSSPADIMKKVHIDIQPTMQKVYNLKTNLPQV